MKMKKVGVENEHGGQMERETFDLVIFGFWDHYIDIYIGIYLDT